jgi:hypothetical protein
MLHGNNDMIVLMMSMFGDGGSFDRRHSPRCSI